jgi:hypothetical protein
LLLNCLRILLTARSIAQDAQNVNLQKKNGSRVFGLGCVKANASSVPPTASSLHLIFQQIDTYREIVALSRRVRYNDNGELEEEMSL